MIHEILPVGMLECNCSIFGDETTREAMVIDPGDNLSANALRRFQQRVCLSQKIREGQDAGLAPVP